MATETTHLKMWPPIFSFSMETYEIGDKVVIDYETTPCKIISKYVNEGEYKNRGKTFVNPYYAQIICKHPNATIADLKKHTAKSRAAFPRYTPREDNVYSKFEQRIITSYFGGDPTKSIVLYCVHLVRADEFGSEACDKSCWACDVCEYCELCDREECGTQDQKKRERMNRVGYSCKFHAI